MTIINISKIAISEILHIFRILFFQNSSTDIPQKCFRIAHTLYGFVVHAIYQPTNAEKQIYFNKLKIFSFKIFYPRMNLCQKCHILKENSNNKTLF